MEDSALEETRRRFSYCKIQGDQDVFFDLPSPTTGITIEKCYCTAAVHPQVFRCASDHDELSAAIRNISSGSTSSRSTWTTCGKNTGW